MENNNRVRDWGGRRKPECRSETEYSFKGCHFDKPIKPSQMSHCVFVYVCAYTARFPPSYPLTWPASTISALPFLHTEMLGSSHIKQGSPEEENQRATMKKEIRHTAHCSANPAVSKSHIQHWFSFLYRI